MLDTSPSGVPELDDRQSMISNDSNGSSFEPGVYEDIESEVMTAGMYDDTTDHFEDEKPFDPKSNSDRPLPQTPGLSSSAPTARNNQWGQY